MNEKIMQSQLNKAKKKPPYSVLYPATSSDSASAKSKGARLTSNKKTNSIAPIKLKNIIRNQTDS